MRYNPFEHEKLVQEWIIQRDGDHKDAKDLPSVGFVSYDDELPVAIAFLRRSEGGYALLDGLVTNPNASSHQRHFGIDLAIQQIIDFARKGGIKKVLAYSVDEGTLKRSVFHGFIKLPHTLIGLDLGD